MASQKPFYAGLNMLPIHHAAQQGDWKEVARQVEAGIPIDIPEERRNWTPLMMAVASSNDTFETIQWLVKNGASFNFSDAEHRTELASYAVRSGNLRVVQYLASVGVDFHYWNAVGGDALIDAVGGYLARDDSSRLALVDWLLAMEVPPLGRTERGLSALTISSHNARFDVVSRLLETGADSSELEWTDLMRTAVFGSVDELKSLLSKGHDLQAKDHWERTAWLLSLQSGNIEKAKLLLNAGSDFNALGKYGQSALHHAYEAGQLESLKWLISKGADLNVKNEYGETVLMEAASQADVGFVRVLLDAKASIEITDAVQKPFERRPAPIIEGFPPIDPAIWEAYLDREEQSPFDPTSGETAIEKTESLEVVRLLVEAGDEIGNISEEMRAKLLGLEGEGEPQCSKAEFEKNPLPRFGVTNPERMNNPFWEAMIRSNATAYRPRKLFDADYSQIKPVWCYHRFGRSLTDLGDGRFLEIGGEHEDYSDPDFYIYNDLVLHEGEGLFRIFGYPEAVFPPTDFHSATLVGKFVYIIGCLGNMEQRRERFTPVYRLDLDSMEISGVVTNGEPPGWIYRHRARLNGQGEIEIWGGKVDTKEDTLKNDARFALRLDDSVWRRI